MRSLRRIHVEHAWLYETASQAVKNYLDLTPPEALQRLAAKDSLDELKAWGQFPIRFKTMLMEIAQLMLELQNENYANNGDIPEDWEAHLMALKTNLEHLQEQIRSGVLPIQTKLDLAYKPYSCSLPHDDRFYKTHREKGFKSSIKQTMGFNTSLSDAIDEILLFCGVFSKRYGNEFEIEM